jgi:hypothetical protein
MGRAARQAQQVACIRVQEARRGSTLSSAGVCDAVAAVAVIAWPACYSPEPSCVTGYLVYMLRARYVCGQRVQ